MHPVLAGSISLHTFAGSAFVKPLKIANMAMKVESAYIVLVHLYFCDKEFAFYCIELLVFLALECMMMSKKEEEGKKPVCC